MFQNDLEANELPRQGEKCSAFSVGNDSLRAYDGVFVLDPFLSFLRLGSSFDYCAGISYLHSESLTNCYLHLLVQLPV